MKGEILIYTGSALPFIWGVAHLFPTGSILRGFGEISADNRRIIAMEWIIEGIALMFIGTLVAIVTALEPVNIIASAVYVSSAICLIVLAIVSLFTGYKIRFLPFRLCPYIFTTSAALILTGWRIL